MPIIQDHQFFTDRDGCLALNGEERLEVGDSSLSNRISEMAAAHSLPLSKMLEIMEDVQENNPFGGNPALFTEALTSRISAKTQRLFQWVKENPDVVSIYAGYHVQDEECFDRLNRFRRPSEFAEENGVVRATVIARIMLARKFFKKGPRRDQRNDESREKMRQSNLASMPQKNGKSHL